MNDSVLERLRAEEKFDEAVEELLRIGRERALTPPELVLKGMLIQMGSEAVPCTLADVEEAYREALAIDENYVPALIELGWVHYAVLDETAKALPLFESAIEVARAQFLEAIEGKMKCLAELQSPEAARSFLREMSRGAIDVDALENKLDE